MGNTVQKVNIATGETWTYGYDLNNRMVSAVDRNADGTLIQEAAYVYDALGDRIQESVTAAASPRQRITPSTRRATCGPTSTKTSPNESPT